MTSPSQLTKLLEEARDLFIFDGYSKQTIERLCKIIERQSEGLRALQVCPVCEAHRRACQALLDVERIAEGG